MSYIDARPDKLQWQVRPGKTATATLNWDADDPLTGRTFVATVEGTVLPLSIVGQVITTSMTAAFTATLLVTGKYWWTLSETTTGTSEDLLTGRVVVSNSPTESPNLTTTVTVRTHTVEVTVGGPPGPRGISAYDVAVLEGYAGTEAEWLADLVGPQGEPSVVPGPIGPPASVYHGADATYPRPDGTTEPLTWVGTVTPDNMIDGDLFLDTDAQATTLTPPSLVVPPISAFGANGNAAWFLQYAAVFQRFDLAMAGTFRYILHSVGIASGNIQVGVARLSGSSLFSFSRVAHSGIIPAVAGTRRTDLGAFTLEPGPHALFFWADNTTVTTPTGVIASAAPLRAAGTPLFTSAGVPASGTLTEWTSNRFMTGLSMEGNV